MTTASIPCASNGVIEKDLLLISPKKPAKTLMSMLSDIRQDLDSFTFGLSELSMRVDGRSELSRRIFLLHNCVENTKTKVDRLMKMNTPQMPI